MSGEGTPPAVDGDESEKPVAPAPDHERVEEAPEIERERAERPTSSEPEREPEPEAEREARRQAERDAERQAERDAERDAERQAARNAEPALVDTLSFAPTYLDQASRGVLDADAWQFPPREESEGRGAIPWVNRRLVDLARRLDQRLFLDPELRQFGDSGSLGYGNRDEQQREKLDERLFDLFRSGFTDMARDEMKPMRENAANSLLDEPFFNLFAVDSSTRHWDREEAAPGDPATLERATSVTVVESTRSPLPRLLRSVAEQTSRIVPGEVDFGTSVTWNRARVSATYQPWTDRDAPALLRSFRIRALRDYEDYRTGPEVVDRFDCSLLLFASTRSAARLLLEREMRERENATRLVLSWACRF